MGAVWAKIAPHSILSQQFPPQSNFDPQRDIPDLAGKVAIVTGGNTGIGYHTVKHLLLKDAKVYLATRSASRCADANKRLKDEINKEAIFLHLDLSDLKSVRKAADEFLSKEDRLDILFNNAGVMATPVDRLTVQGYDLQFGTNVLGHYFFTILLLPSLRRSTEYHKTKARVLNVSSMGHEGAPGATGVEFNTLKGGPDRDLAVKNLGFGPQWKLYGSSKIGNILVSNILVRNHGDVVMSCALHPGPLATELYQHMPAWQRWFAHKLTYPPYFGAYTQLWAGTAPEGEGFGGKYLIPWARLGKANPRAANETTQDKLKAWLDEQITGF